MKTQYRRSLSQRVRAVIAGLGTLLVAFAEKQPLAPKQTTKAIITLERAKWIFLDAAKDIGIPTPDTYGDLKSKALADAMAATWRFARRVFNDYPAELPDGVEISIYQLIDWQAEGLSSSGWTVSQSRDGEGLIVSYQRCGPVLRVSI
jgi:hypothetical protein